MNLTKEEAQRLVQRARTTILLKDQTLTQLCLLIPCRIDLENTSVVAYTNGVTVFLCRRWFENYNPSEQAFIYLHEVLHIVLQHVHIAKKMLLKATDAYVWNIAADAVINYLISTSFDSSLSIPKDGVRIEVVTRGLDANKSYNEWTAVELFEALKNKAEQTLKTKQKDGSSEESEGGGSSMPLMGSDISEEIKELIDRALGASGFEADLSQKTETDTKENSSELTEEQRRFIDLPEEARQSIIKKVLEAGRGSSNIARNLLNNFEKPKINWHAIVRRYLRHYCSPKFEDNWRRPNRLTLSKAIQHFEPARRRRRALYRVGWIVDTSGSMSDTEVSAGLRMIASCREQYDFELILMSADAEVCTREVFKANVSFQRKLENNEVNVSGGGGTDFRPALEAIAKDKPTLVFYYTDGYGSYPEKVNFPVVWLMTTDEVAPIGETINVRKEVDE